ncbi:MAG: chromosomal replication initiator DnaA [Desulfovibrio sp.]|jgi:chromosomal replication initiator protein|nr:chromosomal replication initiator DnaA [Desulfovibrio sp.]
MISHFPALQEENPFKTFLHNAKNSFPLAALTEIVRKNPGEIYNPFTLCGPVGVGKSHLLHTLATIFQKKYLSEQVVCTKALLFCKENTEWILRPEDFWQGHSALLLDDMQELANKKTEQRALELILDACPASSAEKNCQVVFTCAGNSNSLNFLGERLRSRLESGLVVELAAPDMDVRLLYARDVCKKKNIPLERDQCLFLAQSCSQIRLLHGLLLKIKAFINVHNKNPSRDDIQSIVSAGGLKKPATCKKIINSTAQAFNVRAEDILGEKRSPDIVQARQTAMYLCRKNLRLTYADIGREFEGKNHSTIIYAFNKIKKLLLTNKDVYTKVTEAEKNLS